MIAAGLGKATLSQAKAAGYECIKAASKKYKLASKKYKLAAIKKYKLKLRECGCCAPASV